MKNMLIVFQLVLLCALNNSKLSIMHLEDQPLKFSTITHHSNVTQCLGAIGGDVWYLRVAKPSIVDPNVEDKGENVIQLRCGHFFVPPAVDGVQVFKISGPEFLKLNRGTWHVGPLFESHAMDFYNLELSNTNVSSSTECLTSTGSIVSWDATLLILF
ncbi:putative ureidoglycolate hydrolase [Tanacetum coccineum]